MAIALSVIVSLIIGVTVMYQTQYFWGKEDNSNINTLNCTMNNLTGSFGTSSSLMLILVVVAGLIIGIYVSTMRGF